MSVGRETLPIDGDHRPASIGKVSTPHDTKLFRLRRRFHRDFFALFFTYIEQKTKYRPPQARFFFQRVFFSRRGDFGGARARAHPIIRTRVPSIRRWTCTHRSHLQVTQIPCYGGPYGPYGVTHYKSIQVYFIVRNSVGTVGTTDGPPRTPWVS